MQAPLEDRRALRRLRVEHMRFLGDAVQRQWAALRHFEPGLPEVSVGWGNSRRHLLRLHAWTARLVVSRHFALARRDGVFTLSTAHLEDAVRHHAAHLLAGVVPGAHHDAHWHHVADRLGVLRAGPCGAVVARVRRAARA